MIIAVFDTETTSLTKPFCYNIGYAIIDTFTGEVLTKHDYVVEQVWYNMELFSSAYYADKREIYINRMRGKTVEMKKYGHICRKMIRDFEFYKVQCAYAYNSPFDDNVFKFNSDWYKCANPFDTVPIYDIRGVVHQFLVKDPLYIEFCEKFGRFTEKGNYSTTAETVYQFITDNITFEEEHTALSDSLIEWQILQIALNNYGAEIGKEYQTVQSIPREIERELTIITNKTERTVFHYKKKTTRGDKIFLTK